MVWRLPHSAQYTRSTISCPLFNGVQKLYDIFNELMSIRRKRITITNEKRNGKRTKTTNSVAHSSVLKRPSIHQLRVFIIHFFLMNIGIRSQKPEKKTPRTHLTNKTKCEQNVRHKESISMQLLRKIYVPMCAITTFVGDWEEVMI